MKFHKFIKHILFFFLSFLLGAQITYAKTELFLSQSNGSSYSQHNLFDVTFSNDFNSFEFSNIQWLPNNVNQSNLEVISQWDNVAYRNTSNAIENGNLQVVKTVSNQLYVKVVNVVSSFKSIDELYSQFSSFIGNKGLKHIFRGEINSIGQAKGVHHISAVRSGNAKIVEGSVEQLSNGFYKASVEVSDGTGGWVLKNDKSTFFPDSWDEIQVMQEIQSAKNNMIGNPIVNTSKKLEYFGMSSSGNRIKIIIDPRYGNSPGNILTAWYE